MANQGCAEMYREFPEKGYAPGIDNHEEVVVTCEGKNYVILLDDGGEGLFRLIIPGFRAIESEEVQAKVTHAALNTFSKHCRLLLQTAEGWTRSS